MMRIVLGLFAVAMLASAAWAVPPPRGTCSTGGYQLLSSTNTAVARLGDGAFVPVTDPCYLAWVAAGNTATAAAAPTSAQIAQQKLAAGLAITSTGTSALNGTYALDPATQAQIQAVALYIAVNGTFPAAQSTLAWPDISGTPHSFPSTASFQAFATKIADYVAGVQLQSAQLTPSWPAASATIP